MKRNDFKKLAVMGIASGALMALQLGYADEAISSPQEMLAAGGCGGKMGCGGESAVPGKKEVKASAPADDMKPEDEQGESLVAMDESTSQGQDESTSKEDESGGEGKANAGEADTDDSDDGNDMSG